jgi:NADPH2:quinone reductase
MRVVVRITATGGPEVLSLVETQDPSPKEGEVLIDQKSIGVNFLDVTQRNGAVKLPLPSGLGFEAAGVVVAVGPKVQDLREGDRVAYATGAIGSYASTRAYPANRVLKLPKELSFDNAAAILFKAITVQYLLKSTYPVGPGTVVVIYGPAGGVGQILVPWAKHLGAVVVGIVSREGRVEMAKRIGCDAVLVFGLIDIPAEIAKFNGGRKADVVYDSVGRDSLEVSLDSLRPRGLLVSFGAASGQPAPIEVSTLVSKGSLYVTRPSVFTYTADTAEYRERAQDVLSVIGSGVIHPHIWKTFPLREVAAAHTALESRVSEGSIVLKL